MVAGVVSTHMWSSHYGYEVRLQEDLSVEESLGEEIDSTGHVIWPGTDVLCTFLESEAGIELVSGKCVLELGCGCAAFPSMVASRHSRVIATDNNIEVLACLQGNIQRNGLEVETMNLSWGQASYDTSAVDVVIGSDIVYSETSIECLLGTIEMLLKSPNGVCVLGYISRWRFVDVLLLKSITQHGFYLEEKQISEDQFLLFLTKAFSAFPDFIKTHDLLLRPNDNGQVIINSNFQRLSITGQISALILKRRISNVSARQISEIARIIDGSSLSSLSLVNCGISNLTAILKANVPQLLHLDISGNELCPEVGLYQPCFKLETFNISNNKRLGHKGIARLIHPHRETLKILDTCNTGLDNDPSIVDLFRTLNSLESLKVSDDFLTCGTIFEMWSLVSCSISHLSVCNIPLESMFRQSILPSLCPTLVNLNLAGCCIGDRGTRTLSVIFKSTPSLSLLNISSNEIEDGVIQVAIALPANVMHLNCSMNSIGPIGGEFLLSYLAKHRLEYLNLASNLLKNAFCNASKRWDKSLDNYFGYLNIENNDTDVVDLQQFPISVSECTLCMFRGNPSLDKIYLQEVFRSIGVSAK